LELNEFWIGRNTTNKFGGLVNMEGKRVSELYLSFKNEHFFFSSFLGENGRIDGRFPAIR